jgi:hypothetical protein
LSHRSHTVMPRPPYLKYDAELGFKTLWSIAAQILYTLVFHMPWTTPWPLRRQPHDCAPLGSDRRIFSVPQSQRHSQRLRLPRFSMNRIGVSNPFLAG